MLVGGREQVLRKALRKLLSGIEKIIVKIRIKKWRKTGKPEIIYKKFGKFLERQFFINPETKKKEEFILYGESDSIGVLAFTRDKKVITVHQFMQGANKIIEHLPAGGIDENETPKQAIIRELREETGYKAGKIIKVGEFWRSIRSSRSKSYCFLAIDCIKSHKQIDRKSKTFFISISQWLKRIKTNKIEDPLAIITTIFSLPYLKYVK